MSLITVTSPHTVQPGNTGRFMRLVIYATLPGLLALTWCFGWGSLINVLWCSALAVATEAACLRARGRDLRFFLGDCSAWVTGLLLGLALPPFAPWWLSALGTVFAIAVGKQLYGGLGMNPFNPAMVAYALLLVSFPVPMTQWAAPTAGGGVPGLSDSLAIIFGGLSIDGRTMATPLDTFRQFAGTEALDALLARPMFEPLGGARIGQGWAWVNLGFLAGGLFLLARRVISWHIPVAMLTALGGLATVFWLIDPSRYASPLLHLLSGATMLCAFFIATDPVTAAASRPGRLLFGAGIGVLLYIIRTFGAYPDAVAFAVLLMNLAAPTIDTYLQPRTWGESVPAKRRAP